MRKLIRMMAALVLAVASLCVTAEAVGFPEVSFNKGGVYSGFWEYWAEPPCSYLYSEGEELVRVEYISGRITVEWYDEEFQQRTSLKIVGELPIWGGFFAGEDYNFLVYGQENPHEDDTLEVIRVVRYTKDWRRIDHASFYGINTTEPFAMGGFSAAEYGGLLHIHAGHRLYQSADGINHQASFTVSIRQSDMTVVDEAVYISDPERGYVSHSFNQHMLVDQEGRIVTLDHGDALPRGAWLFRRDALADTEWPLHDGEGVEVTYFGGEIGANETNAYVTGLAETADAYLSLYTTVWEDEGMNLYLARTPKEDFSATEKRLVAPSAGEGKIVPVDENGGYLLWMDEMEERMYCAAYHADGTVGEAVEIPAGQSDCQPIVHNGKVVWYVTDFTRIAFYTLDETGVNTYEARAEMNPFIEFYRSIDGEFMAAWSPTVDSALYYDLLVATEEGEWQTLGYSKMGGPASTVIWNTQLPPGVYTRCRVEPRDRDYGEVMEEYCYEINNIELTVTEETAHRSGDTVWEDGYRYLRYDGLGPMDAVYFTEERPEIGAYTMEVRMVDEEGCVSFAVPSAPEETYRYTAVWFTGMECRGSSAAFHRVILAEDAKLPEDSELPENPAKAAFRVRVGSPASRDTSVALSSEKYGGDYVYGPTPLEVEFTDLFGDGYTLQIQQAGCLTWTATGISLRAGDVDLGEIQLLAGDVNADEKINMQDLRIFLQNFNKTGENIGESLTDVNEDSKVNMQDLRVFLQNFNKTAVKDATFVYGA